MKSIANRREKLRVNDLPPEIPDVSGLVTPTDYATSTKGGTIKVDSTYAIEVTSGGKLKAKEVAAADYGSANASAFISKATLDNLIAGGTLGGFSCDELYRDESAATTQRNIEVADLDEYKMLFITIQTATGPITTSLLPPVATLTTSDEYYLTVKIGTNIGTLSMTHPTATTFQLASTETALIYGLYGIK